MLLIFYSNPFRNHSKILSSGPRNSWQLICTDSIDYSNLETITDLRLEDWIIIKWLEVEKRSKWNDL